MEVRDFMVKFLHVLSDLMKLSENSWIISKNCTIKSTKNKSKVLKGGETNGHRIF